MLCPFWGAGGELGSHLTQCDQSQGIPPYTSGILIDPTICLQYTNITDRQTQQTDKQDRTDNNLIAQGEQFSWKWHLWHINCRKVYGPSTNGEMSLLDIISTRRTRNVGQCPTSGRPAEYRWHLLFNAAKFGWRPLLECCAVALPRREPHWNLQGCPKLANRYQSLVGRSSLY